MSVVDNTPTPDLQPQQLVAPPSSSSLISTEAPTILSSEKLETDGNSTEDLDEKSNGAQGPVGEIEAPNPTFTTGKWELYSYYLYYVGNSGLGPFNFQPTQVRLLVHILSALVTD